MTRFAFPPAARCAAALLLGIVACSSSSSPSDRNSGEPQHVLFIGNSLTYTNDLPRTFADVAALGGRTFHVESVARPNVALIDYFSDDGAALAKVDAGGWDWVILQQGPTYPGLCSDTLTLAAQRFADRVQPRGGRTALLMTWPDSRDIAYFDDVRETYRHAALATNSLFIPGGEAWRTAAQFDPTISLYSTDGLHPTPLGTYLVALVIYERLTGLDARELPPRAVIAGETYSVPESTIIILQRAAHETNAGFPAVQSPNARITAGITC